MSILTYLLESSLCLGVFYMFYRLVLQNQSSYQYNRWYLLITPLLSFMFPWLEIPVGQDTALAPLTPAYVLLEPAGMVANQSAEASSSWSGEQIVVMIYVLGVVAAAVYYFWHALAVYRVIKKGPKQGKQAENYTVVETHGSFPTSSFFNYLLWDNTQKLTAIETEQILAHEESHIRLKHSHDVLYITILKIFVWFQPLIYLFDRAITENHEFAADACALQQGNFNSATYTSLLARQTLQTFEPLVNHFYKSKTLKRINMMKQVHKIRWYRYALIAPVAASLFLMFSCQEEDTEMSRLNNLQDQYDRATTEEEKAQLADADEVFMVVEDQPTPEGGMENFYEYVRTNLKYPTEARQKGIEGKVFVQFVVDKDGSLIDVEAIKGIGAGCDEEAVRVLKESAAWNPGQQRGKMVRVRMVLPITFRLGAEEPEVATETLESIDQKMRLVSVVRDGNQIKGKVEDEEGNPLAGANILVKGTTAGTVADRDGTFTIRHELLPENGLVVSFVGFQPLSYRE